MSMWDDIVDYAINPFIPQIEKGAEALTPSVPDPSEELRRQEAERQKRITDGTASIDKTFSQFDDPYYQGIEQAYLDYYNPQLDRQYQDAYRKTKTSLASTGNLNSTAGARKLGDLMNEYTLQKGQISGGATGAANEQRSNVERDRNDLINQLNAGAGVDTIANSSAERANALATPQQYSPIGDVFAGFTNDLAMGSSARRAGYGTAPTYGTGGSYGSASGSVKTVGY